MAETCLLTDKYISRLLLKAHKQEKQPNKCYLRAQRHAGHPSTANSGKDTKTTSPEQADSFNNKSRTSASEELAQAGAGKWKFDGQLGSSLCT